MAGKLIILSGPSGAGKSTIVKHLLAQEEFNLKFSISATSRKMREGEENGTDYHFMSVDDFKSKIEDNAFLEWEEVYKGQYYGTLKLDVDLILNAGKNVIFDIDVMGGINIKRQYKEDAISIFVKPPSIEELEKRLTARNTDTPESIKKRVNKSKMEMNYGRRYDHQVVNEDLETAKAEATELVKQFLS